jgi:hypothetical protein
MRCLSELLSAMAPPIHFSYLLCPVWNHFHTRGWKTSGVCCAPALIHGRASSSSACLKGVMMMHVGATGSPPATSNSWIGTSQQQQQQQHLAASAHAPAPASPPDFATPRGTAHPTVSQLPLHAPLHMRPDAATDAEAVNAVASEAPNGGSRSSRPQQQPPPTPQGCCSSAAAVGAQLHGGHGNRNGPPGGGRSSPPPFGLAQGGGGRGCGAAASVLSLAAGVAGRLQALCAQHASLQVLVATSGSGFDGAQAI